MALRGLKLRGTAVKKSSYYVWFLGAHESQGLRGVEYLRPAVQILLNSQSDLESIKVTLQVSSKGLKIIQNGDHQQHHHHSKNRAIGNSTKVNSNIKGEDMVKHFIPEHCITCVNQEPTPNDDVVACILLLYNPVSKCPVHVHAYRCDSVETATLLRKQLQSLVDHPENQRKFNELEVRLSAKGILCPPPATAAATKKSPEPEVPGTWRMTEPEVLVNDKEAYTLDERMTNLYDSLAAELREKLNNTKNHGPLLLPPRDYDTIHRKKGNLDNVDQRRCLQKAIIGIKEVKSELTRSPDSSGKSSGIGSDEAPSSPSHERIASRTRAMLAAATPLNPNLRNQVMASTAVHDSSSDEDWKPHIVAHEQSAFQLQSRHSRLRRPAAMQPVGVRARLRELHARSPSPPPAPHFPAKSNLHGEHSPGGRSTQDTTWAGDHRGSSRDQPHAHKEIASSSNRTPYMGKVSGNREASPSHSRQHLKQMVQSAGRSNRERSPPLFPASSVPKQQMQQQQQHQHLTSHDSSQASSLIHVKRFDSGHSPTSNTTNVIGHLVPHYVQPQSQTGYQELPQSQRYPGLDRDTARILSHSSYMPTLSNSSAAASASRRPTDKPGLGPVPAKSLDRTDRQWRSSSTSAPSRPANGQQHAEIHRSHSNGFGETPMNVHHHHQQQQQQQQQQPLQHPCTNSMPDCSRSSQPTDRRHQRQHGEHNANTEEKRFYRYSSAEADLCPRQRMHQVAAYRY